MNNFNEDEKEFLEGVRRKVRYLEYIKEKEEIIEKNRLQLRNRKLKVGGIISVFVSLIIVFIFTLYGMDKEPLLVVGLVLIAAGVIYQYMVDMEVGRDET